VTYKFHINDLPRNENSQEIMLEKLKNSDIILLVYDVTNEKSFKDIEKWFEAIKKTCVDRKIVLSILANKTDCYQDRKVRKKIYGEKVNNI
jgi:GTPase SAR1 family protein